MQQPAAPKSPALPVDLMEMDMGTPASASGPAMQFSQPLNREELVRKRLAEEQARVEQAQREVDARRAAEESERSSKVEASNKLRTILDAWAKTPDGASWKDIRTLLSTVHEVIWKDSGWQPVGLADLLQDGAIKRIYRKAIIITHPDKMKDADPELQIRAERIFQALNEAFKAFQDGEQK